MIHWNWADPKRRRWTYVGLASLGGLIVLWAILHQAPAKASASPAVPVTVAIAGRQDIPVSISEIGAAQAWTSVTILAQVSGKLLTVNFTEGTNVRQGDILAQIDPSAYQAALQQAEGTLAKDQAALADAKFDLARYKKLAAVNSIATQQVDTQAALVRQDEGTVESDGGVVQTAKVNLGWTTITAPISGRVGVRFVDPGNIVSASGGAPNAAATAAATNTSSPTSAGGSGIVIINQIQPIAVTFTVPEGDFQNLAQVSDGFHVALVARAYSQETGALLDTGELSIADNRIDPSTGTIELKARFPNAESLLWPGQFVNVQLTLQTMRNVTTIPMAAVNRGPSGQYVFLVGKDKHVTVRPVKLALTQDTTAVIASGVKPGDVVVIDGQMTLKAGSLVRVAGTPKARPNS